MSFRVKIIWKSQSKLIRSISYNQYTVFFTCPRYKVLISNCSDNCFGIFNYGMWSQAYWDPILGPLYFYYFISKNIRNNGRKRNYGGNWKQIQSQCLWVGIALRLYEDHNSAHIEITDHWCGLAWQPKHKYFPSKLSYPKELSNGMA